VRIPVVNVNTIGIIKDVSPHELPLEAWSNGSNCRVQNGALEKFKGHNQAFAPVVEPYWLMPVPIGGAYYWLYAGAAKVYAVTGTSHTDISRTVGGAYTALPNSWTGGIINGLPVLNDGTDVPQMWSPVSLAQALTPLSNWPAGWLAATLRPFKQFLIAMDITKSGSRFAQLVAWSHPALPGLIPSSWDSADVTKDAGENTLSETAGAVIDCLPLRDYNIVYKDDSIYLMQFVGGIKVFNFIRIGKEGGLLARNCVRAFSHRGEKHFAFSLNDIFVHDGQNVEGLLSKRAKAFIANNMDPNNYGRSFVVANYAKAEMWACFPTITNAFPNLALVWNWIDNTTTFRDLPLASFAESGLVSPFAFTAIWDTEISNWEADPLVWDTKSFSPATQEILLARSGAGTKNLYVCDSTDRYDGVDFSFFVERQGLTIAGRSSRGELIEDIEIVKELQKVWPRIEAPNGTAIQVYTGAVMERNETISWQGPATFTVGTDEYVDLPVTGRLLGVKFTHTGNAPVRILGYDLDIVSRGRY